MASHKRKLIEVALPLEAINRESAREKSIRHGHPSTLHLWWARRPLAACRAVLFAQLVDDPSSRPEEFPDEESQARERKRLFDLIEQLVRWENSNNETILKQARAEIWKSCDGNPPPILDPFAGGGSIPLEAQRLGLEAHASDLNPVAVLINKALIEIPPKWAGQPPVYPGAAEERLGDWPGATGLAEDVRRYGRWMRNEAEKRIGHLYPKATLPDGSQAPVIAWIWARTVRCPNPACGIRMPLVRSWWLGKKKGKEAYVVPRVANGEVTFSIGHDVKHAPTKDNDGTVKRTGAVCVGCGSAVPLACIRAEGKAKRIGTQLMAIVAEGRRRRIYLPPNDEHEQAANIARPDEVPDTELPKQALGFRVQGYGMTQHADLFTNRQLVALTTFADLVLEAQEQVRKDAENAERINDDLSQYANGMATYLAFLVGKVADRNSEICTWDSSPSKETPRSTFARQALPMTWDTAEGNIFGAASGNFDDNVAFVTRVVERLSTGRAGHGKWLDAMVGPELAGVACTDPPYYDNVGYADLADFFYIWLRRCLVEVYPELFGTMLTPKASELVADPARHGKGAEQFFENGFIQAFTVMRAKQILHLPMTVFYAFKQTESDAEFGEVASTGWEKLLEGLLQAGWSITSTWPIRTELGNRMRSQGSNALASSIVLSCRPRQSDAGSIDRRGYLGALRAELPAALKKLQEGSIAPVDLAQAAIGPGMAVFSRYGQVVEPDGSPMRVRTALTLINQVLAEVISEQEGDFDADTRWCLKWFEFQGFDEGVYGRAETLASAYNVSIAGLERAGVLSSRAGKVTLFSPADLPDDYDPGRDDRISAWEFVLHLAKRLDEKGVGAAATFMQAAVDRVEVDTAKELSYLLFSLCEKRGWSRSALLFNALATSWPDLVSTGHRGGRTAGSEPTLEFEDEA